VTGEESVSYFKKKTGENLRHGVKKEAVEKEKPVKEEKGGVLKRIFKIFGKNS